IVRVLMAALTKTSDYQGKELTGHPWWANSGKGAPILIEAQTRINTDIILTIIEEALQPQNKQKFFMVCLAKISPGELATFFSDLAVQLNNGRITALPSHHLPAPLSVPSNFSLVATMDTSRLDWADDDLLSGVHLIY
ncbi:MAG: hypothetical protein AB1453_13975, partial [Chloroflexota bacterium]